MSRSIPVVAVIAILAVAAIGTGYAYTAVYTQDMGSSEIKVSYIEVTSVTDSVSKNGNVAFKFQKTGLDGEGLYMDLTLKVTSPASGYLKATLGGGTYYAKIVDGQAKFVAIPVTASSEVNIAFDGETSLIDGEMSLSGSVSELVIYSTGGSS